MLGGQASPGPESKHRGRHSWRLLARRHAYIAPIVVAFAYTAGTGNADWVSRILGAVIVGIASLFGMLIAIGVAGLFLGDNDSDNAIEPRFGNSAFVGGMVLAAFTWVWWHIDKDRSARRIASCVHERVHSAGEEVNRTLVMDCYRAEDGETIHDFR